LVFPDIKHKLQIELSGEKEMKMISYTLIFIIISGNCLFSRAPFTELKVGYQNPADADAGYIFGANFGRMIDESLSWSFELNYFQKGYKRVTQIEDLQLNGIDPSQKQLELEYRTHIIPFFLKINYEHALGYRSPFYARASAGLGWEMLWNKVDNYVSDTHKTRFYHGFGWQGAVGVGFAISTSANLFLDGIYNGSKVKRNESTNENGLPIWEELDISGLGIRVGVSIVGFGW
jgi:hypothetical protein